MSAIESLLSEIEDQWADVAAKAIVEKVTSEPALQFYAAGFWMFYADFTVLDPPNLSMNSESYLAADKYGDSNRWIPPNLQYDVIQSATDAMYPRYEQPSKELAGGDEDVWEQTMDEHKQEIARVCRRVTADARAGQGEFAGVSVVPNFVLGIFEEQDGEFEYDRLVELSIGREAAADLGIPYG